MTTPVTESGDKHDDIIQPYRMHVSMRYLELTRRKLELARLPREPLIPDSRRWELGTPKSLLEPLIDFWTDNYDWRSQESTFNETLPQYRTIIDIGNPFADGENENKLKIHFVHKRSARTNAVPLLYCHGWPGSFIEVSKIINTLSEPIVEGSQDVIAFHVIVPSIPGFGFSDASPHEKFGAKGAAEICNTLMLRLGYNNYVVHGDGWGFTIARMLALNHSPNCLAVHTCSPNVPPPSIQVNAIEFAKYHVARLTGARIPLVSFGYVPADFATEHRVDYAPANNVIFAQQYVKRPQTMAYSLCDSPVGLLACMLDGVYTSSSSYVWTPTEILDWTMMQWLPGPEAGLRWLRQANEEAREQCWQRWSPTPLGISSFRTVGEGSTAASVPGLWAGSFQKLIWAKRYDKTARLPVWDAPDELVVDLREFFAGIIEDGKVKLGRGPTDGRRG